MSERAQVVNLLREALGTVCTPAVREKILEDAVARARTNEVPSSRERLKPFIDGPFRKVLEERLGQVLAGAVISELHEMVFARTPTANEVTPHEAYESHPRLKQERVETVPVSNKVRSPAPSRPGFSNRPQPRSRVWIATLDRDGVGRIASRLDADLHVVRHVDEIDPLDAAPNAVIVDLRAAVDWKYALFGLGGRLAPGTPVMLWGGDASSVDVLNVCRPGVRWLSCGPRHTPEQLCDQVRQALIDSISVAAG